MRKRGFTLIEIVLSVALLGIVFGGVTVIRSYQVEHVRKLQYERDVLDIHEALSCYLFFNEGDEIKNISDLFKKGFLIGENRSPWGTPYRLELKSESISVIAER